MQKTIGWIMEGPAWIKYQCQRDLLDLAEDDAQVKTVRKEMLKEPKIRQLIVDIKNWNSAPLKRHNDAAHPLHKLAFLAEIGLTIQDPGVSEITSLIMQHRSDEGPFQILCNYPTVFGGSGEDDWLWCLCDAPLVIYALLKLGLADNPEVNAGLNHLSSLRRDNGWPCKATSQLGKFHGPGKSSDPCPYANLLMLKTLAVHSSKADGENIRAGVETALSLWENSQEQRPYLFRMGTDFRKLKAPFIWYDILHLADVISHFSEFHQDKRFQEILAILKGKADNSLLFSSESIWTKWKGWEFCQKREPSRWITLCVLRIFKRVGYKTG